jgi:hypothetical protein
MLSSVAAESGQGGTDSCFAGLEARATWARGRVGSLNPGGARVAVYW